MKFFIFLLPILLVFTAFITWNPQQEHFLSKGEQLVNSLLARTAKSIKGKYGLKPCGEGVAMPGGPIQKVALYFDTKYPHTKEQLRELLLKSSQELLEQVTENEEIQEFLAERPFVMSNVQIIIYNKNKNGSEVYDPGISTTEIAREVLTYQTVDVNNVFKYKHTFIETYEDALKEISNY